LINNGGHGNGIGTEEGTQAEAYDIDEQPLFDVPSANCTAFYADGQTDKESEEEDAQADPDADVPEDVAVDGTATGTATATKKKKISKRTSGYTLKEDVCLCRSWLAISQGTISGAELKGKAYWRRVTVDYHESPQFKPFKIHSDYGQVSIQKRWSLIQQETNKFSVPLRLSNADPRAVPA
jgi:hypothetical protein